MHFLINSLAFFWILRTIKFVLFWVYLWQLKSYHIGRFIDHFRTHKGKTLIFNFLFFIKLFLLFILFADLKLGWLLLVIYFVETILFAHAILKNKVKRPSFTFKAILLPCVCLVIVISYAFIFQENPIALLSFDILTPLIISIVVLSIQPFFVLVRNRILQKAKNRMRQLPNLKVIGITGSYGKTSTKEFLTTILSAQFNVLATPEHKNSEMGIAQTILENLNEKHQIFIVEMGAYNKGGIKLLCDIVRPSIGIVTGVNQQHLSTFGSLANLLSAEGGQELADSLPKNGLLVVNGDNNYCLDLYKKFNKKKKLYSVLADKVSADIWTEDIMVGENSLSFITIFSNGEMQNFAVDVLGRQQVQNLLGAILIAKELGMSFEKISEACRTIRQAQGGATLQKGIYDIRIIDSSYSSNPNGVMADLDYLNVFSGKKIIVMPCLIELGKKSKETHREIGKKIAEVCDLAIITTKDHFEEIKKGAMENGMPVENILLQGKAGEALTAITTFAKAGDVVLLEGRAPESLIKALKEASVDA